MLGERGHEFGTVTGRERRCGWLDLVGLRYAARVNGLTELAVTKLDVLSMFDAIPVCVAYRLEDGTETTDFPSHQTDFHHARPVYRELEGWGADISDVTSIDRLPAAARAYLRVVEEEVGVPIAIVGTGARRDQTIMLRSLKPAA